MQCKYVRESTCMSFTFHPKTISLFSLVHFKNRLRIIQQNLYTGLIMNDLPVPLKQQIIQVDNYQLCYNSTLDLIILTLSNHILIYSIIKKSLLVVLQANMKNMPLFIDRICSRNQNLYFSAPSHKLVYAINIKQCIKNASINNYIRYKISGTETEINQIAVNQKILVALCNDKVLRVWDIESTNQLKGIALENIGRPTCFCFSKSDAYLLIGTSDGYVQVWDGQNLGVRNVRVMSQKIGNIKIQSLCWFHYAGQSHSLRFLAFTEDGNIKLYSFWFQKKDESVQGRCSQLSLLYTNRHNILDNFMINSHSFANFIFFSPGVLLYMVDFHPLVYYPVVPKIPAQPFTALTPNTKKQIYYPRDILFMKGLQILRLKDTIQPKLTLQDDLQYKQLKILRLQMRPWTNSFAPVYSKLMVIYYLNNCIRVITISKVDLNLNNGELGGYREYNGSWVGFLGPRQYYQPFIFIVQQDKQTITVLSQNPPHPSDPPHSTPQQQKYFQLGPGQLYTKKLQIKIHKVYQTPFRNNYVLLYQSDNLLRFSNNINYQNQLINYDVYIGISLRMDYTDIVLDVVWTFAGEIGAVVCLDKVVFVNGDLKVMRSVVVGGYIVQAVWVAYTLVITTKKDVQYVDILSKPQQAYCLQSLQSKYLIAQIMSDRIIGIQKPPNSQIVPKCRYFKLTQPLISGYLNYQKLAQIPIDQQKIKQIIQAFAPYYIVTEQFIQLLNQRGLVSISKYFIQGNQKMYSKPLRAKTLNQRARIERFIDGGVWGTKRKVLEDLFLSYEESKDSNDPYQVEKGKMYANKIKSIIGNIAFDSIKDLTSIQQNKGVVINNNFGEQSLYQLYYDISKQKQQIKMQIYPFKAQNCGQWLGHFGLYLQSKPYYSEDTQSTNPNTNPLARQHSNATSQMHEGAEQQNQGQDQENMFKNLAVYFRCDDGKGETVEDLSDYGNNGTIKEEDNWSALQEEPMEVQDKWGKKCPPQFSLSTQIKIPKKLNMRKSAKLSLQIWIQPNTSSFQILCLPEELTLSCHNLHLDLKLLTTSIKFQKPKNKQEQESSSQLQIGRWSHIAITINAKDKNGKILLYVDGILTGQAVYSGKFGKNWAGLTVGDTNNGVQYTEVRIWTKELGAEDIKENMRTPLELVAEKRKKLKMKLKQKKKKQQSGSSGLNAFSLD